MSLATPCGYSVLLKCGCGQEFTRWVTPEDADEVRLRSAFMAFENLEARVARAEAHAPARRLPAAPRSIARQSRYPNPGGNADRAAGTLSHAGLLGWWLALPVCIAGVLSGDLVLYWTGRHWGERVLNWRGIRWVVTPQRETRLKGAYCRHAVKTIGRCAMS
jgi:hypothetical protein